MRKEDEKEKIYFRSDDRFVRVDDQWWFTTRDGDQGPYASREAAERALRLYIDGVQTFTMHQEKLTTVRESTRRGDPTIWNKLND